jgi:hypothetical protein
MAPLFILRDLRDLCIIKAPELGSLVPETLRVSQGTEYNLASIMYPKVPYLRVS